MIYLQTLLLAIVTLAVLFETFRGAPRYRGKAELLLSDRAAAEVERALRGRRKRPVVAVARHLHEAEGENNGGDPEFRHDLISTVRGGR